MSDPIIQVTWIDALVNITEPGFVDLDDGTGIEEKIAIGAGLVQGKRLIYLVAVDFKKQAEICLEVFEARQLAALLQQAIEGPVAPAGLTLVPSSPANDGPGGAA
ncbi:hypothetical protein [Blastomonas sp.]|jgi:hypothetical protein|uniref:hypothetical protein n=1 Tax=Blastomonas sp. TaxID=1909299 RepID=UPI00406A0B37